MSWLHFSVHDLLWFFLIQFIIGIDRKPKVGKRETHPAPGPAQKDDKKKDLSGAVGSVVTSTLVVGVAAVFGSTLF